jgi:hypothetical protein
MSLVVAVLCLGVVASAQKPPDVVPDTDLALSAEQTARATGMSPLFDHIRELSSIVVVGLVVREALGTVLPATAGADGGDRGVDGGGCDDRTDV